MPLSVFSCPCIPSRPCQRAEGLAIRPRRSSQIPRHPARLTSINAPNRQTAPVSATEYVSLNDPVKRESHAGRRVAVHATHRTAVETVQHVQSVACLLAKRESSLSSPRTRPACFLKPTTLYPQAGGRSSATDHQVRGTASTTLQRSGTPVPARSIARAALDEDELAVRILSRAHIEAWLTGIYLTSAGTPASSG